VDEISLGSDPSAFLKLEKLRLVDKFKMKLINKMKVKFDLKIVFTGLSNLYQNPNL
jgi:hypothetical protein